MTNEEVVEFLDKYCEKAATTAGFDSGPKGVVAEVNTTIAHLLCEEARKHWKKIVEEEDVMVDDISCIVLEFVGSSKLSTTIDLETPAPKQERLVSIATIEELYKLYPQFDLESCTQ